MDPLKTYYAQETEIWMKNHPNIVVTHYQITGLVGKDYLQSATPFTAAHGFQKTSLFPDNVHTFDKLDRRRILAQHLQFFFFISVSCSRIEEEPPTASGTDPQGPIQHSFRLPHKTALLFSCPLTSGLRQISLTGNKKIQLNMSIPGKNLLLVRRGRLQKQT
jgi:hypothetical protein